MASLPPAIETFDLAEVKSPEDLAAIGQKIFFSKGQCALCHSIGPSESARCPDLNGIGAKLAPEFIYESLTQPQAYIYLDFRHATKPEEYPARMPHIDKDPIGLTKPEIFSVIAFLQKMSGEPISIKVEDIMESAGKQTEAVEVAFNCQFCFYDILCLSRKCRGSVRWNIGTQEERYERSNQRAGQFFLQGCLSF